MQDDYGYSIPMLTARLDRQEGRLDDVENKVDGVPELRRSVDRLITAVYAAGGTILVSAFAVIMWGPK